MHLFIRSLANNRGLLILLSTNAIILFAAALLGPISAIFVEKIGGDLLDASLAGAAYALAAGVTVLLIGRMSDAVKENELLVVAGYLIMAVGFISYIWVDSVVKLLISQLLVGFGEAVYSPAFDALYSKHLDKHQAGVEWGLWESMRYFMLAGGAVLGGVIVNVFDFNMLFIVMGIMSAASGFYILFLPRKML